MHTTSLQSRLRQAARRLWALGAVRAAAWAAIAASAVLLVAAWLDLLWELSPEGRIGLAAVAAVTGAVVLALLVRGIALSARRAALARRLDAAVAGGGQILTGWELEESITRLPPLTAGLGRMAVESAVALADRAPLARAVPARPLARAAAFLAAVAIAFAVAALLFPDLARTEWYRFRWPYYDVPPYSPLVFTVTPGDVEVTYGSELEIAATVEGGAVDRLELVLEGEDGGETPLPMFNESDGTWRAVLSKVTEPVGYFICADRARSEKYRLDVVTVPQFDKVRVRIVPPAYAGQATYEGPAPEDGVKGLRGAEVTVWAASNRPLGGGTLVLTSAGSAPARGAAKPAPQATVAMQPVEPGAAEAIGRFKITGDARLECRVIDEQGQASQQSFSTTITMLADQHPMIRILEPPLVSLATPTVALPVVLAAEDDCGVARVQLFRSLNDSRPLPANVPMPRKWPHRLDQRVELPLTVYGLSPGDVIKLFGRVEDNDPAGAKGAESPVVTVKIISQEEFERMLRVRQGLNVLASKYREARRRLENAADEMEGLRKKLKKLPPEGRLAEETRREVQRLQRLMRRHGEELRKSAAHRLPFDLDAKLSPELDQMAELTEAMARELEKLQKQEDLLNDKLDKRLKEMAQRLDAGRRAYEQSVMLPMDLLEAVFPLLVEQERFTVLVLRQQDLAERMTALRGHDGEDNPALKSRMRDLEHEQRQIRLALADLLHDIEDHATRLPDRPELKKLRETAIKFAKDVSDSGAATAMSEAEAALSEFAGTRAQEKARRAAEILEQFLKRCEGDDGMAAQCQGALVFQPKLGQCLGNTLAQLLAEMGLRSGGAGGFGSYGLYGDMAGMSGFGSGEQGDPNRALSGSGPRVAGGSAGGGNPDRGAEGDIPASGAATSVGEAAVPIRYRQSVGQYFQRLADELGDRPAPRDRPRP